MTGKRLLLYGTNYYPEPIGIPRYTTEMAEDMAAAGHEVTVVTAAPLYPTWTKFPGYSYGRYTSETRNGVRIERVPTYVPRNTGFGQRIIYEFVFWLLSMPVVLRHAWRGVDAVVVTSPPLVLCCALLLPFGRARKAVIVKDLQIDIAENMGIVRHRTILRLLYRVERFLLNRADVVTAVSLGMLKRIGAKGLTRPRCEFFPDWVDTERLTETAPDVAATKRRELGLPAGKIIVGYSGNLARKQGIELLIEMARRFHARGRNDLHFLICGDGPAKSAIVRLVRDWNLPNMTLAPLQPEADLPALLTAIDVHAVMQKDEVSDLVMPGKIFNIMSCGRALVVTAPPASAIDAVMTASGAGIRVSREDRDGLEAAIEKLAGDPGLCREMGRKGRNYVVGHMAKRSVLELFYSRIFQE
jgi:colanic acid biosynthesis glycosyl transferase WcaI